MMILMYHFREVKRRMNFDYLLAKRKEKKTPGRRVTESEVIEGQLSCGWVRSKLVYGELTVRTDFTKRKKR